MNTNKNQKYRFNLLPEEPSNEDIYTDKTHENVASTLFSLISTSTKAFTIGLEGSWGAGKSTVVNILNKKIINSDIDTVLFKFDAWAHEGDPLRRIFLESLIKSIDPEGENLKLTSLLEKISNRKKTVSVKSHKESTLLASLLFASTLAIPFGTTLLSSIDIAALTHPWDENASQPNYLFLIGFICSISPFIVLLLWAFLGQKNEKGERRWSLVHSDSEDTYTQDISDDNERTSIEFENFFSEIIRTSVAEGYFKKLVIVIDNLDRIEPDHAKKIWATLQTFFQQKSLNSNLKLTFHDHVWFLVPYDKDGLEKIWGSENIKQRGKSFLSKSFQIVAEVPTPAISAWDNYLNTSANRALSEWPTLEKTQIVETFQKYWSRLDRSPTPREIQNFINQCGLNGMNWGGQMSAESIALYSILRLKYSEDILRNYLLSSGLPDNFESPQKELEIKMELSGMLFGVNKEKGVELLLSPLIKESFINADGAKLKQLMINNGGAFWVVWRASKNEFLPKFDSSEDMRISFTTAFHDGLLDYKKKLKSEIDSLESVWLNTQSNWDFKKHDYSNVFEKIISLVESKDNFLTQLSKIIQKKFEEVILNIADGNRATTEIKNLQLTANFLQKNDYGLKQLRYSNLDANNWETWLLLIEELNIEVSHVLPATGTLSTIASAYISSVNAIEDVHINVLDKSLDVDPSSTEWEIVANALVQWGNSPRRQIGNNRAYGLMMKIISNCPSHSKAIKDCIQNAQFWVRANQEDVDDNTSLLPILSAISLGGQLQHNTHVSSKVKAFWSTVPSEERRDFILNVLKNYQQLNAIWELAKDKNNRIALDLITKEPPIDKLFSCKEAILNVSSYEWIDESNEKSILEKLSENGSIKAAKEIILSKVSNYAMSVKLIQLYGQNEIINELNSALKNVTKEEWEAAFTNYEHLLDCAINHKGTLDHKYKEAFEDFYLKAVDGTEINEWYWTNFDSLLDKAIDKNLILKSLCTRFFSSGDVISDVAFDAIKSHISKFINSVDNEIVMQCICDWIDELKYDRLEWFINSNYSFSGSVLEGLLTRIESGLNETEENTEKVLFEKLRKIFSN